jgi:PAS domain S-box-containing protein
MGLFGDDKRQDEQLGSEDLFRNLMKQSPLGIIIYSPEGQIIEVNNAWLRLWGFNEEEAAILAANYNILTDRQLKDLGIMPLVEKAFAGEPVIIPPFKYSGSRTAGELELEINLRSPWIECNLYPVKDEEGKVIYVVIIHVDVTERKDTEQQLESSIQEAKESEERFRGVVENANEAIVVAQDGTVKYGNPQIFKLTGYSPEELGSRDFTDFIHPEDRAIVLGQYRDRLSGENPSATYTIRIVMKDGSEKYVLVSSALIDWEGKPATLAMLTDITELKHAEEEIGAREERFRNLMEQSPLAIVIFSPEGKITEVNPAWCRQWGVNREETAEVMANYNIRTDRQHQESGAGPLIERAFAGENIVLPPVEYVGNRALQEMGLEDIEANTVWIQCHLYPVRDKNGDIAYLVHTNVDITELKRAEEEAHKQRETLARLDRATSMGQLTGSIAHELNQPLTGILSNSQAAEMMIENGKWKNEELLEIIKEIVADTKRAGDVIHNLRDLYREQKGDFQTIDVDAVVDVTTKLLHSEMIAKKITLTKLCAESVPPVNGNRTHLQQVLVNLILNGMEAMSGKADGDHRLSVSTSHEADEVMVWVDDNGPGIDTGIIDKIFEPLATWKPGGTGMGLAISSSIIEAHKGRMWAENLPGGGARVGFALPVLKGDQQV